MILFVDNNVKTNPLNLRHHNFAFTFDIMPVKHTLLKSFGNRVD